MPQQQPHQAPADSSTSITGVPASDGDVGRLRYIEHKGKRVLLADVTTCSEQQVSDCIKAVPEYVTRQPEHSVLLLGDFSGTHFTKETVEQLKIAAAFDRPHVARAAWVLSDNLHKVLLDSIRAFSAREIAVFDTREEALDYLVS